jgi:hypothetical protein
MQPRSRRIGASIAFTVCSTSFSFSTGTVILMMVSIMADLLEMGSD